MSTASPEISWQEYRSIQAMNVSTLVRGKKSMYALKKSLEDDAPEPTPAMIFGTQYHSLILEPEDFARTHCVMPDFAKDPENHKIARVKGEERKVRSSSGGTTWAKKAKADFARHNSDKIIVEANAFDKAMGMLEGLNRNEFARELVQTSEREITVGGQIEGITCKGRVDLFRFEDGVLSDLKGTKDASDRLFGSDAARLHYCLKMAWYRKLLERMGHTVNQVFIIALESAGDYECAVYEIPEPALEQGFREACILLQQYKGAMKSGRWDGVDKGQKYAPLYIPNYWMDDEDEMVDFEAL